MHNLYENPKNKTLDYQDCLGQDISRVIVHDYIKIYQGCLISAPAVARNMRDEFRQSPSLNLILRRGSSADLATRELPIFL